MCCGNNSKFKQLNLGKSGDSLEISQGKLVSGFCLFPVFTDTLTAIFFHPISSFLAVM